MTKKTNKKKLILDKYDPVIYPIKLCVAKNIDKNKLKKEFKDTTEDEFVFNSIAITITFLQDKEEHLCCIVLLSDRVVNDKDILTKINTCAHEAGHYVIRLFDYIGLPINPQNSEAFTYLQSWATECIYKTLIK